MSLAALVSGPIPTGTADANDDPELLFSDEFTGSLDWEVSDSSVYIRDGEYLYISASHDGSYNDGAWIDVDFELSADHPLIIEQRIKLESGGQNYTLPWQKIHCESGNPLVLGFLPHPSYGWAFGTEGNGGEPPFTQLTSPSLPGENYWVVTRAVLYSTGGTMYMKPDDAGRGWSSDDFTEIVSATWSHSSVTRIYFDQPWDSVNWIDWVRVYGVVPDVTAPEISVSDLPTEVWPANHKMVRFTPTVTVLDDKDEDPALTLEITSNEAVNGSDDGDTDVDWVIHSPADFELRAERSGSGSGRVYTLVWTATDCAGNSSEFTATVTVPKSKGK